MGRIRRAKAKAKILVKCGHLPLASGEMQFGSEMVAYLDRRLTGPCQACTVGRCRQE
jgi:hypothetical protein